MDKKESGARILTLWLIVISTLVSVLTNIATSVLPAFIQPFLWIAWPILGLLVIVYLLLTWLQISPGLDKKVDAISSEAKSLAENAIKESKSNIHQESTKILFKDESGLEIEFSLSPRQSNLSIFLFYLRQLIPTKFLLFILQKSSLIPSKKARNLITLSVLSLIEERQIDKEIKKAKKQTLDLINTAKRYNQAMEFVAVQRQHGKLSQQVSENAIYILEQDFEVALDQIASREA